MHKPLCSIPVVNEYNTQLERKIRYATEPENPRLIDHWLDLDMCRSTNFAQQKEHYERQYRLLLDTIADEMLPGHWRRSCLGLINKPLLNNSGLSGSKEHKRYISRLNHELNLTCEYVLSGLSN